MPVSMLYNAGVHSHGGRRVAIVKTYFGAGGFVLPNGTGEAPPGEGGYCWIDIEKPTDEDLLWLQNAYNFHPLTIEDTRHFDQRAKVEEYDTYLFITMAVPRHLPVYEDVQADELQAYLGAGYLVTVHTDPVEAMDRVRQRLLTDTGKLKTSPDFLLYLLADQFVDRYFAIIDDIEDEIEKLEDEILAQPDRETLNRVFKLKQQLVYMRRTAGPERDLFHSLSGSRFVQISSQTGIYFRDIYDHVVRIYEGIETSRDLLSNALDAYLSVVSNRLNEVMKRLTVIATIFMPLSFIVGFGGMNFQLLPFGNALAFAIIMFFMIATPATMMIWFWRNHWM
jgi:magnesium transporter